MMGMQMSEQLPDVTYWLALEISKNEQLIDLDRVYQGSAELDYLYQLLTSKAKMHWWNHYGVQLNPVVINNAFFRAVALLHDRHLEFSRARNGQETIWVKELLHIS